MIFSKWEFMAKVSTQQIDIDEKTVIRELQQNSNESIDEIAKRCGFSRQKVWSIIKRLESNHTIWGYHAVVDNDQLRLKRYILLVKKTNRPIGKLLEIILSRDIERNAEKIGILIHDSIYLHGFFDWLIVFTAENIKQAKKFCEQFNFVYQNYVSEIYLIEEIFPVKYCSIQNPNVDKIKDFI
jgi:DNA-binding Lrp family transcriptional regulator